MRGLKNFDREFEVTNRLRAERTQYLLNAACVAGTTRFVVQSFTGWPNERSGGPVKSESEPLDSNPPETMRRTLEAIRRLEEMVSNATGMTGIVLCYGAFYGLGTSVTHGGEIIEAVRLRKLPVIGDGRGVWSWLHIDDCGRATQIAIERGPAGIYNIVDDEPAEVSVWLPYLARVLGARPPLHLPVWPGRLFVGDAGISLMTRIRGSSNAKARQVLNWQPACTSWREGFRYRLA
jgi:nucleoside-diphosphate-sugar epimerase